METTIHYVLGNEDLLDHVELLWLELNKLHYEKSRHHKKAYVNYTFEARKESLLSAAKKGRLCTVLAYSSDLVVGYCIASIVDDIGEVDSLFISPDYRKRGIADKLMDKLLHWLTQSNPKKLVIKVSIGNEEVFGFYAKYGFYPCLTELQRVSE